jgi:hypothetical protein
MNLQAWVNFLEGSFLIILFLVIAVVIVGVIIFRKLRRADREFGEEFEAATGRSPLDSAEEPPMPGCGQAGSGPSARVNQDGG